MDFRWELILVAMIGGLFGLLTTWFGWKLNSLRHKKDEVDLIDQTINSEFEVKETLKEFLNKLGADRISIYQFHNGERYYQSCNHMKRISKNVEVCNIGIAEDLISQQDMPVSLFIESIKTIILNGYCIQEDTELVSDHSFKDFMVKKGILSIYGFGIFSLDKKLIGILTISYIKNKYKMSEKEIQECVLESNKLAGFLI